MKIFESIKIWYVAARPKTLSASVSPVIVAIALAYSKGYFNITLSVLCLLVALFAQIASNYANDYFDFFKGIDNEKRTGPERAVAMGWVSAKSMLIATFIAIILCAICGIWIVVLTKWWLFLVGIAIVLGVFAYSSGPYPLSHHGLGDVAVMFFYGIVPVCATVYVLTGDITMRGFLLSMSMGFVATNILIVNNYRDYESDMAANKRTSIVMFGKGFGAMLYIVCTAFAIITAILALCINDTVIETIVGETENFLVTLGVKNNSIADILRSQKLWLVVFSIEFAVLQFLAWKRLQTMEGNDLNYVLALTARNVLIWAIFLAILLVM